jgi:hypothetical protein
VDCDLVGLRAQYAALPSADCIMIYSVTSPTGYLSSRVSFLHVIDPIAFIRFSTHKFP